MYHKGPISRNVSRRRCHKRVFSGLSFSNIFERMLLEKEVSLFLNYTASEIFFFLFIYLQVHLGFCIYESQSNVRIGMNITRFFVICILLSNPLLQK